VSKLETIDASDVGVDIANEKVLIFSKTTSSICDKTKDLFKRGNISYKCHELDKLTNGSEISESLKRLTGQDSVPSVFINGHHLGGNDEVQAAFASGDLLKKLEDAGVTHKYSKTAANVQAPAV